MVFPARHKLSHPRQVLARLAIRLPRLTDDNQLHALLADVFHEIVVELRRRHCGKPSCNDLQGVGHGKSGAFLSVVYRQYACHGSDYCWL